MCLRRKNNRVFLKPVVGHWIAAGARLIPRCLSWGEGGLAEIGVWVVGFATIVGPYPPEI